MPRRRGEYTLTKSTSFTIFPIANSTDRAFYSAADTDQGTYKAKICLNVTITPDNCTTAATNDAYKEEHESSLSSIKETDQQQSIQPEISKTRNDYCGKLSEIFSRNFSNDNIISDGCNNSIKNRRRYRTTSHDSSFRNSLKYSFEKIKLCALNQKYSKHETKLSDEIISLMNLMPDMLTKMKRNSLSGKDSRKKSRKVQRSKSGALKKILSINIIFLK
ncbi:unnamed protein product [Cercopithifilaria johnstoni]|uniref:Uncharacterized protein n=1 Tax=Cercopithifilaria johnstoni TaxID=2874296 RepID=A0A8J2M7P7_9BILA|nr:unnamed protein product [Cercopithifilaria johnstoni]